MTKKLTREALDAKLDNAIFSSIIAKGQYTDKFGDEIIDLDRILIDRPKLEQATKQLLRDFVQAVTPETHQWDGIDSDLLNPQEDGEVMGYNKALEILESNTNDLLGEPS